MCDLEDFIDNGVSAMIYNCQILSRFWGQHCHAEEGMTVKEPLSYNKSGQGGGFNFCHISKILITS